MPAGPFARSETVLSSDLVGRPIGDARRAVETFAGLLRGETDCCTESWSPQILGPPDCEAKARS